MQLAQSVYFKKQSVMLACAALGAGWLFGVLAWGEGRAPTVAALLPLIVALVPHRFVAWFFVYAYELALLRTHPEFLSGWFGDNILVGWAMTSGYAVASAFIWSIGWATVNSKATSIWGQHTWRLVAMFMAWLLALLPPAAVVLPAHPVVAWGYFAPGWGWLGVAASLLLPMGMMIAWFASPHRRVARSVALALIALAAGVHGLLHKPTVEVSSGSAAAVTTEWGKINGMQGSLKSIESIGHFVRNNSVEGISTYIWPESIVGVYQPTYSTVMRIELLSEAKRRSQVHIVGMDVPNGKGGLRSIAVAYYPDGTTSVAQARQPAIVSLWRPWSNESYEADWQASHELKLADGRRASILFCYEEFLPILFLMSQYNTNPDLYVAMSNTWASPSNLAAAVQTHHSLGMARLFGKSFLKAENRPRTAVAKPQSK